MAYAVHFAASVLACYLTAQALTHAIESYTSLLSSPLSEGLALHAIRLGAVHAANQAAETVGRTLGQPPLFSKM